MYDDQKLPTLLSEKMFYNFVEYYVVWSFYKKIQEIQEIMEQLQQFRIQYLTKKEMIQKCISPPKAHQAKDGLINQKKFHTKVGSEDMWVPNCLFLVTKNKNNQTWITMEIQLLKFPK